MLSFPALPSTSTYINLYHTHTNVYRRKILIVWNYRLMVQTDSLYLFQQEKKLSSTCTESHCKHLEAAFDQKILQLPTLPLVSQPNKHFRRGKISVCFPLPEMETISCKSFQHFQASVRLRSCKALNIFIALHPNPWL